LSFPVVATFVLEMGIVGERRHRIWSLTGPFNISIIQRFRLFVWLKSQVNFSGGALEEHQFCALMLGIKFIRSKSGRKTSKKHEFTSVSIKGVVIEPRTCVVYGRVI
jgi:hypothetical protein